MKNYRKYCKRKNKITVRKRHNIIKLYNVKTQEKMDFNYDKLAEAIVKAQQIEKENEKKEQEESLNKWRKEIGYNDHIDKKGLKKIIFCFCNMLKLALKMMFISRKKHIVTSPTSVFFQGLTSMFFSIIHFILTLLAIAFAVTLFVHPNIGYVLSDYFMQCVFAILSFMLSRIFRLMAIEIDQMSNREQILGVFTAVISIYPLIEKAIELFKGVG